MAKTPLITILTSMLVCAHLCMQAQGDFVGSRKIKYEENLRWRDCIRINELVSFEVVAGRCFWVENSNSLDSLILIPRLESINVHCSEVELPQNGWTGQLDLKTISWKIAQAKRFPSFILEPPNLTYLQYSSFFPGRPDTVPILPVLPKDFVHQHLSWLEISGIGIDVDSRFLSAFPSLRHLDVSRNNISGFPIPSNLLANLTYLNIENNEKFNGIDSLGIGSCPDTLILGSKKQKIVIKNGFDGLHCYEIIGDTIQFYPNALSKAKLNTLVISGKTVEGLQGVLDNQPDLRVLTMRVGKILDEQNSPIVLGAGIEALELSVKDFRQDQFDFSQMTSLKKLSINADSLDVNQLLRMLPNSGKLEELKINANKTCRSFESVFLGDNLRVLNVNFPISDTVDLWGFLTRHTGLEVIMFEKEKVPNIPMDSRISRLQKLRYLDADNLTALPDEIIDLPNLNQLNMYRLDKNSQQLKVLKRKRPGIKINVHGLE